MTEAQINRVWEKMIEAEVRSLYFGHLASMFSKRKQVISGVSFFLSSGAAVMLLAKMDYLGPLVSSLVAAGLTAYTIAFDLDRKAAMMAKLHYTWNKLAADYDRLWNHWYEDNAEIEFDEIARLGREASELATTEAPYNKQLITKWQDHVHAQYGIAA